MLIDSHVHLDDKRFNRDREMIIKNLERDGVELVINNGIDLRSSKATVDLVRKYDNVYGTVGVHPHSATEVNPKVIEKLREYAKEDKILAIGEIGLDFHYDNSPRDIQRSAFKTQIELAKEVGLPIVIHSRDADQETYDIVEASLDRNLKVLLHCYSGSAELAKEFIKLGCYLSIAGPVTFKNARMPKAVSRIIPLDKLLIETDCPYLTPDPYRGKRNEPKYVKYVAQEIAELKGISVDELAKATADNTKAFFNIPK